MAPLPGESAPAAGRPNPRGVRRARDETPPELCEGPLLRVWSETRVGAPHEDSTLVGPVKRFGRYTLVKKLATGGMAEIWLARQRGLAGFNRFVVIKKILSHLSEQKTFVDMFLDEARTSAQLNHPNIVQIFDLGREEDAYYIAMEYIAGENLAAVAWRGMKRHRPIPPTFAARIIADACKALHYAHHLRGSDGRPLEIVHRDISPQNVLVTYDGEVKIVDFGIAKAATKSEQTKTGMLKGKFSYMSPEQCLGAPVDMRSDVFALGILLYELCTGKRLFKHESELMILEMITKRTVVPPSQVAEDLSPLLDGIIMRALAKNANERYQTAQELQHALEGFLREEPHPATSVELGEYVRSLFGDKIDEKRRMIEIASRDDFEERHSIAETESFASGPRRTVHGLPPSQVMVRGVATGARGSVGSTAAFVPPTAGTPSMPGYAHPSQYASHGTSATAMRPGPSWANRAIIALALFVIAGASLVLWAYRQPVEAVTQIDSAPAQSGPIRTGSLSLKSKPSGAIIELDGNEMPLPDGTAARTPVDLGSLQYGKEYRIRLRLDGHRPFEQVLIMDDDRDGATLEPELVPLPATVVARVEGSGAGAVRVFFGEEEVGSGPAVRRTFPGDGRPLEIRAERPGRVCRADPARVTLDPDRTVEVRIRCRPPRKRRRTPRPAVAKSAPTPTPEPSRPAPPAGCAPDPGLPKGFLTIDTRPPSQIFYRGRKLGETPLPKYPLPAGCIELQAKSPDKSKTFRVRIEPNGVAVYRVQL